MNVINYNVNSGDVCQIGRQYEYGKTQVIFEGYQVIDSANEIYFKFVGRTDDSKYLIPIVDMTLDITQQLTKHVGQFSCQLEEMNTEGTLVSQSPVFYVAVKRSIKVGADYEVQDPRLETIYQKYNAMYNTINDTNNTVLANESQRQAEWITLKQEVADAVASIDGKLDWYKASTTDTLQARLNGFIGEAEKSIQTALETYETQTDSNTNDKLTAYQSKTTSDINRMFDDSDRTSKEKIDKYISEIEQRRIAGEFNGSDGYTPVKGKDYFTESEIVQFKKDVTPKKRIDYFTDSEISQIQNEVSSGAIGEFRVVVQTETDNFNTNAANKVSEFDAHTEQIQSDVNKLKSDLNDLTSGKFPYEIIDNSSIVVSSGSIVTPYDGWSRTNYIDVSRFDKLNIEVFQATLNCWYDFDKNKIGSFGLSVGMNEIVVPSNAKYAIISATTEAMHKMIIYTDCDIKNIAMKEYVDQEVLSAKSTSESAKNNVDKIKTEALKEVVITNKSKQTYVANTLIGVTSINGNVFTGGDYDAYCYTQKIPVSEGEIVTLDTDYSPLCAIRYICTFNGNNAVSSSGIQNVREYIVPNGIDSVVLSYNNEWSNGIVNVTQGATISKYTPIGNILSGKKWCACGDSFTANGYSTQDGFDKSVYIYQDGRFVGEYKTYPWMIGLRNDMNIVNLAVAGMTISNIVSDNSFTDGTNPVYMNIPSDSDYITLKFGINDMSKSCPIGTIDDTEISTFYGAWNTALEYITNNFPFAKVGIIVSNGMIATNDYVDATIEVAKKWGIPYLDEVYDYTVPLLHYVNRPNVSDSVKQKKIADFQISADNFHPNVKAHEYESTFVEDWLRSL